MKKNKLCLQMSHRAVLNIKGVKKGDCDAAPLQSRECCGESKVSLFMQAGSLFGISQTSPLTFSQARWCNKKSMQEKKTCKDCQS